MKIRFNAVYILTMLLTASVFSCKKDQTMVVASSSQPVQLTASQNTLILDQDKAEQQAVDISWNKADFGYAAAINYSLQVSFKDADFTRVSSLGMGSATTTSLTVADLNTLLLGAKYLAGEAQQVQLRVLAAVADSLFTYSDVLTLTVTPYMAKRVISYPTLYMPGDYQGWDPGSDQIARVFSIDDNGIYKGYVNITTDVAFFKFTVDPNWDGTNYGTGGDGLLSATGDNLEIDGAGYYLVEANTNELTWKATLQNWGMIGDAAGGWDDADEVMMDFDPTEQVLTKTMHLNPGGLKFRANHDWGINIGVGNAYGADNIPVDVAGTYVITLDLRVPDEPVYTLTLQ